jgi:hypothetical protein
MIGMATSRFRLRFVKVLLVEGSDTVSTLLGILVGVIRRQGTKAH